MLAWLFSLLAWAQAISIIIPVLNEESAVKRAADCLVQLHPPPEILFVDGGSQDQTVKCIEELGLRCIEAPGMRRGSALNEGANTAQGTTLLFLHVDTLLSQEAYTALIEAACTGDVDAGAFSLAFQSNKDDVRLRLLEKGVYLRNHLFHLVYGDQGFFIRKEHFIPFNDMPLMEDVDWFGRVKKSLRWKLLRQTVATSPRRIYKKGIVRSSITNIGLVLLYKLGVAPEKLAGIYYQKREPWKRESPPLLSSGPEREGS